MATKFTYSPYKENNEVTSARSNLVTTLNNAPKYQDTFGNDIKSLYESIKATPNEIDYNPENDAAYRQYADQYRALTGLAIASNHAQAQDLTGGYGSTYAPEVARQGEARLNEGVEMVQPAFYQLAQQANDANLNRLYNMYNAAGARRDAELDAYAKQADMYNDRANLALNKYNALADRGYEKYKGDRESKYNMYNINVANDQAAKEYQLKVYDTYNTLAANKCADFNAAKNNKGMKKYLDGLVKKGKLTQYMADNLYKQYKYVAPVRSGGGGGGGRRGSGGSGLSNLLGNLPKKTAPTDLGGDIKILGPGGRVLATYNSGDGKNYEISAKIVHDLASIGDKGSTKNSKTNQNRLEYIKNLKISSREKNALLKYYGLK